MAERTELPVEVVCNGGDSRAWPDERRELDDVEHASLYRRHPGACDPDLTGRVVSCRGC